jgi:dTDP-4-amino-4,6-dideoxygalactose transaminase
MKVPFSYLDRQFAEIDDYLDDIRAVVAKGDYTLGAAVAEFERRFAAFVGLPHMVGVGSGTDALILPMKLLGIGPGDEVITAANTFIATVGAIVATGARPRLLDSHGSTGTTSSAPAVPGATGRYPTPPAVATARASHCTRRPLEPALRMVKVRLAFSSLGAR